MNTPAKTHRIKQTASLFAWGLSAPLVGLKTVATTPSLWLLSLVPSAMIVVVASAFGLGAGRLYDWLIARASQVTHAGALGSAELWLAKLLAVIALFVVVLVLTAVLVPPLSAPAMDALAGRVDRFEVPKTSGLVTTWRSIRVALGGMAIFALPQLLLAALALLFAPLSWLFGALGVIVAALSLAFDALDWPLARRGLGLRQRLAWMGTHKRVVLGLGTGVSLLALIPGLPIVLLPAIVVGAVSLIQRVDESTAPPAGV
ncbi:MAG: EI24 domain-containing protein [Deltaproteobacteria bacterium]|nr:EI24 domain-containing protein [Deltaproteobacteria bacterium]